MERLLGTPRTVGRSTAAARRSSRTAGRRGKDCTAPAARWGSRRQQCNEPLAPAGGRFPECAGPAARSERPVSECSERLIRRGGPSTSAASGPPPVSHPRRLQPAVGTGGETGERVKRPARAAVRNLRLGGQVCSPSSGSLPLPLAASSLSSPASPSTAGNSSPCKARCVLSRAWRYAAYRALSIKRSTNSLPRP